MRVIRPIVASTSSAKTSSKISTALTRGSPHTMRGSRSGSSRACRRWSVGLAAARQGPRLRRCRSSSSSVRGQSFFSSRESARSASRRPSVWQIAQ
jgi:hypothetical protein